MLHLPIQWSKRTKRLTMSNASATTYAYMSVVEWLECSFSALRRIFQIYPRILICNFVTVAPDMQNTQKSNFGLCFGIPGGTDL